MKLFRIASFALMLAPAVAMATDAGKATASVQLPEVLTPAGVKFAGQCSDEAFAGTADQAVLADQCERLLANWRSEASRRLHAHAGSPRPARSNYIYSDTLAVDNTKPEFLSLRSVSPYQSSR